MFKFVGLGLAAYIAYALANGRVVVKSGFGGRTYTRDEAPQQFWSVIAIYGGLVVALFTVF